EHRYRDFPQKPMPLPIPQYGSKQAIYVPSNRIDPARSTLYFWDDLFQIHPLFHKPFRQIPVQEFSWRLTYTKLVLHNPRPTVALPPNCKVFAEAVPKVANTSCGFDFTFVATTKLTSTVSVGRATSYQS